MPSLELQWLSLDQGSTTEPRMLVGDVYSYVGLPVASDGSFTWESGVVLIDDSTHAMISVASVDALPLEFPWSCP